MHRTDMDVTVVFSDFSEHQGDEERAPFFCEVHGWRRSDVVTAIRQALAGRFDVILLGPIDSGLFYDVVAERLKTMVQSGTGLIFTGIPGRKVEKPGANQPAWDPAYEKALTASPVTETPSSLTAGVPFAALPGFNLGAQDKIQDFRKVAALFQFGRGRVMRLNLAGGWGLLANAPDMNDLRYEYYQSFAIKSVLWAAGKEPAVALTGFPATMAIDRADQQVELTFGLSGGSGSYDVRLAVRCPEKLARLPAAPIAQPGVHQGEGILRPVYEAQTLVQPGQRVRFALPRLPAGSYFADCQVLSGGKKVQWATAALTVTSKLCIAQMALNPPWIDVADGKSAQLEATATLTAPAPRERVSASPWSTITIAFWRSNRS